MKLKLFLLTIFVSNMHLGAMPSDIYTSIITKAFAEIDNGYLLKNHYEEIYKNFGMFIETINDNEDLAKLIRETENKFLADAELKDRYCQAPPSYRDPRKNPSKRHDKVYFQFVKEHYQLIQEEYPELLIKYPIIKMFLDSMLKLDEISKTLFLQALDKLEKDLPGIKEKIFGDYEELTVISKIVRYEKSEKWGTTPHFDKSALTLIWDSSDPDNDCLLVCEDSNNPTMAAFKKPTRLFTNQDGKTSTLLITGLALPEIDINVSPTAHGVAPIKTEIRYAVISFLLVPHLDMTKLQTDFIEKK